MNIFKNFKALSFTIVFITLALMPIKTGFEIGHSGYIGADALSIVTKANIDNNFLGYMSKIHTESGIQYNYFNRYPPFFSGTLNTILKPLEWSIPNYIIAARIIMNIIYLFTMLVGFWIIQYFINDKVKALGLTLLVFSSHFFIHYRSTTHFDQIAILGNLIVLWGIIQYKIHHKIKLLIGLAIIVPLWGRGYSSIFLLFTWNIFELLKTFKTPTISFLDTIKTHIKSKFFLILILSIPLTASFLANNIYLESKKKNISVYESDIVDSAMRRLGFKKLVEKREKKAKWPNFISKQIDRKKDLFTPELFSFFHKERREVKAGWEYYLRRLPAELVGLIILILFLMNIKKYYKTLDDDKKIIALVAIFSGFVWLYTMRKLATYHDYTTLYYVGLLMIVYISLFSTKFSFIKSEIVLKIGLIVFFGSLVSHYYQEIPKMNLVNHQAYDIQKIRNKLKATDIVYVEQSNPYSDSLAFIEGSPQAHFFFFADIPITSSLKMATKVIKWQDKKIIAVDNDQYSK